MADTVKQINQRAFMECSKLSLIKFPKSLLYIGSYAFKACVKLEAIFIPESCREVGIVAFEGCKKLMVLNVSRHALLRIEFIADTALLRVSPFTVNRNGRYKKNQHYEVVQWVRNINSDGDFALHRICASFDPCEDTILELVRVNAPGILQRRNKLGMTPMDYLSINPSSNVDIQKILNGHILGMMEFRYEDVSDNGYHRDDVTATLANQSEVCDSSTLGETSWGCTHVGNAAVWNPQNTGYYNYNHGETVEVTNTYGSTVYLDVVHHFSDLEKYYDKDHRIQGALFVSINGQTLGEFSHPKNGKIDTHLADGSVNPDYKGKFRVTVTCDDSCICDVSKYNIA